jgi:hypothetical protein
MDLSKAAGRWRGRLQRPRRMKIEPFPYPIRRTRASGFLSPDNFWSLEKHLHYRTIQYTRNAPLSLLLLALKI